MQGQGHERSQRPAPGPGPGLGQGQRLASERDQARLRERERAERARVERVLARGPRDVERRRGERTERRAPMEPLARTSAPSFAEPGSDRSCRICGARDVFEDEVFDRGPWRVARCLRCDHRSLERVAARFKPAVRRPAPAGVERCANGA